MARDQTAETVTFNLKSSTKLSPWASQAFAYATDCASLRLIPLVQLVQRASLIGPLDDAITLLRLACECAMREEWRI